MSTDVDRASRLLAELSDPKAERRPSVILDELVPVILALAAPLAEGVDLMAQFVALPRDKQFSFLIKAAKHYAEGIKLAAHLEEVPA